MDLKATQKPKAYPRDEKEGRSCRACFTAALGWVVLGGQGLGVKGN
jgi:hypothetical protein